MSPCCNTPKLFAISHYAKIDVFALWECRFFEVFLVEVSSTPFPLYTVLTIHCFPNFICRMVVQNVFEAVRKSFFMASPNSYHARGFASATAIAAHRFDCQYLSASSGVPQALKVQCNSFFSLTASLIPVSTRGCGCCCYDRHRPLCGHSTGRPPRHWKHETLSTWTHCPLPLPGDEWRSPRGGLWSSFWHGTVPGLSSIHHRLVIGWKVCPFLHPSVQDMRPQIWWHNYKVDHRTAA